MPGKNVLVCGLVLLGLLASGSAVASRQAGPTLTINNATVTAKWRESWLKGNVRFSATVSASAQLEATLRSQKTHRLVSRPLDFSVGGGTFTKTIKLSARPVPGTYRLRITGTSGGTTLPNADRLVSVPAPQEGVVDRSYASKSKNSSAVHVIRGAHQIFAHFHFLTRPKDRFVRFIWRTPSYKFIGAVTKKYRENVWTFVRAKRLPHGYAFLQKGTWYCIMRASGRVAKRVSVRVT